MELTNPQKMIYTMEKFAGGSVAVICGSVLNKGKCDVSALKRALNEIYRINDALRMEIIEDGDGVSQRIRPYQYKEIEVLRFADKEALDTYANAWTREPMDMHGDLCDFKIVVLTEQYGFIGKLHHIIGDAWTLTLLANQTAEIMAGKRPEAYSYADYAASEQAYVRSRRYERDKAYFIEQFQRCDEPIYLSEKQGRSFLSGSKMFATDKKTTKLIADYAKAHDISPFILFTAALSAYFSRIRMNAEKFYIGTAVLNRFTVKDKNTAGMFINTVPMLIELDNEKSFADNIPSVEDTCFSVMRHHKYNYGEMLKDLHSEFGFRETLYDVLISYQNATLEENDVEATWYHGDTQTESLAIHIDDREQQGIFKISYEYKLDLFGNDGIDSFHREFITLLLDAIENDRKKLYELKILNAEEEKKILFDFNDTACSYPTDQCIHELFEERVKQTPDRAAIVFEEKPYTFRQLDEMSNSLAHFLMSAGIKKGDPVPIVARRTVHVIIAMLAILKAGGAYVPIDYSSPTERIDSIIKELNAGLVLVNGREIENVKTVRLDDFDYAANPSAIKCFSSPNDPCYVIYTSGSTGIPKGVCISHQNVANYCTSSQKNHMIQAISRDDGPASIVSVNNICFDAFLDESFLPILNGITVYLTNQEQSLDHNQFIKLVNENRIEIMSTTPTKFRILTNGRKCCLKHIIFGGEALTADDIRYAKEITSAHIYNTYGPTECTCGSTYTPIEVKEGTEPDIHIGRPIANTQIYITDKYMNPVPAGIIGEICIAGAGVGLGYLKRPELTKEKYVDNPFGQGRLYKTGDLAYWREDGNIVYVGRYDSQVKIRGLRIELGEIENAISSMEGISQAVVTVRKNSEGRQFICAFYTGEEIEPKEIRLQISRKLPKYMVPHVFTRLEKMPLTASGKINRNALPDSDLSCIANETEYIAPKTNREKKLCRIMETVLNISPLGIGDDFFELGGDSLKAIEFVSEAHNEGIYFNVQTIFDHPTVQEMCRWLENEDKPAFSYHDVDFSRIQRVLARNADASMSEPKTTDLGSILLTGATGFLGIHILAEYLENDNGTAYCIIRGNSQANSEERLKDYLRFYFGSRYTQSNRIRVICGDLQYDRFNLSEEQYSELLKNVDTIINCAGSVKHYGTYQYFEELNVESTRRQIDFAKAAHARFIHASTLSVSGGPFDDKRDSRVFTERSLYIGQKLDNVYSRSKFEAEKMVLEAIAEGLPANIMRMGNLTNRYSDGVFQRNYESNAFLKRIMSIKELGMIPDYLVNFGVEFTPVDEAAKAVMTIARHFSTEKTVFHICNTGTVPFSRLAEDFSSLGCKIDIVSEKDFTEALHRAAGQAETKHIYENFVSDMDENDILQYNSMARMDHDFTAQYLKQLGFVWKETDRNYLKKYLEYFQKIGYHMDE